MELKVISFNIRCCDDSNGHAISERAPRLKKVCAPFDADIIGFQEFSDGWVPEIERDFADNYIILNKWRAESDHESSPILWKKDKFECVNKGCFWLSETPEVESRGWDELYDRHRICQWVILKEKESGKVFTYMNTHYGFGDKGQTDSSRLIYEYSKKISSNPTFITGDFNMNPKAPGYAEMVKNFTDANMVTLKNTADTYHGYQPSVYKDTHIDYCFVDKNVTPISMKVIDETVDGKFPSDHFGLYIVLDI